MTNNGHNRRHFEFADYRLYPHERLLTKSEKRVALTPRILDLLIFLVEHDGELVSKDALLDSIWADSFVEEGNISRAVSTLRKNLGSQPNGSDFIETVPKLGYRFIAPVAECFDEVHVSAATQSQRGKHSRWAIAGGAFAILGLAVLAFLVWGRPGPTTAASPTAETDSTIRLTDDPNHDTWPSWTRDGRIRFTRTDGKSFWHAMTVDADGSDQTVVNDVEAIRMSGTWSPDGSKVLFAKPGDKTSCYIANSDGSNEITLPFFPGTLDWSADSQKIVFQKRIDASQTDIFIYDLKTTRSQNLTNDKAFDADPSFSPDGTKIAFASIRDGNTEIYLMNSDGTGLQRLTDHRAWDNHPVFSPDGTQIAFPSDRDDENSDVYVMNIDGSNVRRLTDWRSNEAVGPGAWSPDGTRIVFTTDKHGFDDLYVMNAEVYPPRLLIADEASDLQNPSVSVAGQILYKAVLADKSAEVRMFDTISRRTRIISKTENGDVSPVLSPDGTQVAFQTKIGSNTEVCLVNTDISGFKNLTNDASRDSGQSFSPDGKQIVFASNRGDNSGLFRLFVMNSDGSDQRQLHPDEGQHGVSPVWTPDGTGIVFVNDAGGRGNFEIYRLRMADSTVQQLTARRGFDMNPAVSPDGKRVAFVSNADGNWEIYVMNIDGSHVVRLTRHPSDDATPQFSHDGKQMIFSSNRSGRYAIYEMDLPE